MTARRRLIAAARNLRELGSIASAVASTSHPYMAHIVPMRRCNLACTYCNEFDDVSDPVPVDEMLRRIDHLGRLGTSVITISGGEPTLPSSTRSSPASARPAPSPA
jgi:MoaA/NifB/PqqE/SkfB family radical SAM enzyme